MHFGSDARTIGRYVVDIDGCLHATDEAWLSATSVAELRGTAVERIEVAWERAGENVVLGADDRVEMDEGTVQFFRTSPRPDPVRSSSSRFPFGTARRLGTSLPIAA